MVDRILPTPITVFYQSLGDSRVALLIQTPGEPSKHFTVVHDSMDGVRSYEVVAGTLSPRIDDARDFECITITVRDEVAVVASGIFEVNSVAASDLDCYCLIPRSLSNLLLTQIPTMRLGELQSRIEATLAMIGEVTQ